MDDRKSQSSLTKQDSDKDLSSKFGDKLEANDTLSTKSLFSKDSNRGISNSNRKS